MQVVRCHSRCSTLLNNRARTCNALESECPRGLPLDSSCKREQPAARWRYRLTSQRRVLLILACIDIVVPAAGCSRAKIRHKPGILVTRGDIAWYVRAVLEHGDADVRREAINVLANVRHPDESIVDTFDLAARADPSDAVRCAAIRALGRHHGANAVATLLAILENSSRATDRRDASDKVRWEAINALLEQAHRADVDDRTPVEDRFHATDAVRDTAMRLLASDPSRDVRLVAARLLGDYPSLETLHALIDALGQSDFGVVYEAERALTRLTGKTHGHRPASWKGWLASTSDPFAERGALDGTLDPRSPRRWWPW